ncbi:MAG: efflux transporter outer membrane subunit [Gammaproteobacteria bacterium]
MRSAALSILMASSMTACSMVGTAPSSDVQPPANWQAVDVADVVAMDAPVTRWWQSFNDPLLTRMIEEAAASNKDVAIAEARLLEARAAAGLSRAALGPQLNAGVEGGTRRDDLQSERMRQPHTDSTYYQAGFDASWEIDVFGGLRAGVESARADFDAAKHDRNEVMVSLIAEVARNYFELRGAQARLDVAQKNIDDQTDALSLLRSRARAGLSSETDVAKADADLQVLHSAVPPLQEQLARAVYRLSVLRGRTPQLDKELTNPASAAPKLPDSVAAGFPSDLLQRRPDVRAAQAEVLAANARVGVAKADLLPKFYVSGLLASAEEDLGTVSLGPGLLYSIGPSVRLPIFNAGRLRANVEIKDARLQQALHRYEQVTLQALEEVDSALSGFGHEKERLRTLTAAVDSANRAEKLAKAVYASGLADYFSVIDAQRSRYAAEDALANCQTAAVVKLVAVYKALGGGWDAEALNHSEANVAAR